MKEPSSTEKGDEFEAEVFDFIRGYVNKGGTFLNPKKCQFFTKKGYYSHIRKKDIKVDVSIESHTKSIDKIALLLIIECKNYEKKVPVDDVEEFVFKLEQIAGKNIKGMMFSKKGFSSGALSVAQSTGIALARLLPSNEVDWILERTPDAVKKSEKKEYKNKEIIKALTTQNYRGQTEAFFSIHNNKLSNIFTKTFNNLIHVNYNKEKQKLDNSRNIRFIQYLGQEDIELKTKKLLEYFDSDIIKNKYEVNVDKILKYLVKEHKVKYNFDMDLGINSSGNEILGKLEINKRKIFITNRLETNTPRWRFTLSHEIGHLLLHRNLDIPSFIQDHMDTDEILNWSITNAKDKNIIRLEWQANSFASSLLLPRHLVYDFIFSKLNELDIRNSSKGVIYLDEQQCNIQTYQNILFSMKQKFNVSYQAINYRLAQLNLLNNKTKQKKVSKMIQGLSIFES